MAELTEKAAQESKALLERVLYELKKVIVGQEHLLERLIIAVIAQGHVLVEGAPGLAKTLTLKSLAQVLSVEFKRIQFTPDLLPADLIGTRIYNPGTGAFSTELGPIHTHFLLTDEINRAPAKVQSALLEAMQERQVTIGRETYGLKSPFLVMATQNPIESEGTYNLPEAQLDRFLFKLIVGYPDSREETAILQRMAVGGDPPVSLDPVLDAEAVQTLTAQAGQVYFDPKLMNYVVDVVQSTRADSQAGEQTGFDFSKYILHGASPRGSLALIHSAKALALYRGRNYVKPEDVVTLIPDCLRHRIILSFEGLAEGYTTDKIIHAIQERFPSPVVTSGVG